MEISAVDLDHTLDQTERFLGKVAAIPVLGTPFGALKVAMGIAQCISALALGILTLSFQCTQYSSVNDYCWSHVVHGMGNILAGIFEAIPLLGTVIASHRCRAYPPRIHGVTCSQTEKYMPYQSLVNRDNQNISNLQKILLNYSTGF